jgi:hypothetical protein
VFAAQRPFDGGRTFLVNLSGFFGRFVNAPFKRRVVHHAHARSYNALTFAPTTSLPLWMAFKYSCTEFTPYPLFQRDIRYKFLRIFTPSTRRVVIIFISVGTV